MYIYIYIHRPNIINRALIALDNFTYYALAFEMEIC